MSFSDFIHAIGDNDTDNLQTKLDEPYPHPTYIFEDIMDHNKCHHGLINKASNTKSCIVYELYSINNGEIPKPYPIIDRNLEEPFEDTAFKQWDEKVKATLFCRNCWFDLISSQYLHKCLKHIVQHLRKHCLNPFNYVNNEESYVHLLFLIDMMRHPFVINYVLIHQQLYKQLFRYYFAVLQLIYCNDIFFDKYKYELILDQFVLTFVDHFVFNSFVFWKKKNIRYLQSIGFKQIITESVLDNLVKHLGQQHLCYSPPLIILALITGFDYVSDIKLLHNDYERDIFIRKMCILILGREDINKFNTKYIMTTFFEPNSKYIISPWFVKYMRLIYYEKRISNKDSKEWNEIICQGKLHYKLMRKCFNPACKIRKYRRNVTTVGDIMLCLDQSYDTQLANLIKNKFYKCKGCFIALYCSSKCQKIHWNKYNHREQCNL